MKTVEAIKTHKQIDEIQSKLNAYNSTSLYGDIWKVGINLALRISDLLELKFDDIVKDGSDWFIPNIKEGKTSKMNDHIKVSDNAKLIIMNRREQYPNDIFIFQVHSNRTKSREPKPVSRVTVSKKFKEVGDRLGLNLGTHSMRKTKGFMMYQGGKSIEMIAELLNHSSTSTTRRYIGLTKADLQATYDEFNL